MIIVIIFIVILYAPTLNYSDQNPSVALVRSNSDRVQRKAEKIASELN